MNGLRRRYAERARRTDRGRSPPAAEATLLELRAFVSAAVRQAPADPDPRR